jgi:hypothetical protein
VHESIDHVKLSAGDESVIIYDLMAPLLLYRTVFELGMTLRIILGYPRISLHAILYSHPMQRHNSYLNISLLLDYPLSHLPSQFVLTQVQVVEVKNRQLTPINGSLSAFLVCSHSGSSAGSPK